MLKDTNITQGTLYLGKCAGKEIYQKIENATSSIKIITPYISSEFIELLKNKSKKGLEVRLIISSDIGSEKDKYSSLRKLIRQTRQTNKEREEKRNKYLKYLNFSFVFWFVAVGIGLYYKIFITWYALIVLPILYFTKKYYSNLVIYSYTYGSELSLSIPMSPYTSGFDSQHTLTHAKLFIIDNVVAYVGSINFTKAAFWKNYESRVKLTQKEVISDLGQEFDYIFMNKNTYYLNISTMGSRIYSEPPN